MGGSTGAAVTGSLLGQVAGATLGFMVGGPAGAVVGAGIGGTAGAYQGYTAAKTEKAERNALSESIAETPPPPPAAKPATLAQAAAATRAKAIGGTPVKAKASGTIGDKGPQGLVAPPQTANLTLLGGTK